MSADLLKRIIKRENTIAIPELVRKLSKKNTVNFKINDEFDE